MKKEFSYLSADKKTQIHAISWTPEAPPRATLQIAHGMVEFIDRYDRFAAHMAQNGFYVVGNDHLGHGQSVRSAKDLGFFSENGNADVIADMHRLALMTREQYPKLPAFLLGHSMGSFLARQYITLYGGELSGAIIMGTGQLDKGTLTAASALAALLCRTRGIRHHSPALKRLSIGSYNKQFEPARTPCDWLTRDEKIVDLYMHNPLNQFDFTAGAYRDMFRGMAEAFKKENIGRIPKDLPLFFVSGEKDPVGNFGKGVQKAYAQYQKAGMTDLSIKLYPDDRHEILNELDREIVDADILRFLNRVLS